MRYSNDREEILRDKGDIVIIAGAGSGKTTILTRKIEEDILNNRSHYKIAAMTFTNKAANEIKSRISIRSKGHYIGTNDGFVENEIIRPFIRDVYGNEYNKDFEISYSVNDKFDSFEFGLLKLRNENKLGTYNNNSKNFKFELAKQILKKSKVAKQYIRAKYFKMYIDEYQDSDKYMHELFMYIKNELKIKLFIVGDIKQSIYEFRGASPKLLKDLSENENNGFSKYELIENFRCTKNIQNYANIVVKRDKSYYQEVDKVEDVIGIEPIRNNTRYNGINLNNLKLFDLNKEIAILIRYSNWREEKLAENLKDLLNESGYNFTYIPKAPIEGIETTNKVIFVELAKYIKNSKYSIYDFISNLGFDVEGKEIKEIESIIKPLKEVNSNDVNSILTNLFRFLNTNVEEKEIELFKDTIENKIYDNSYNGKEFKHKIMTIHSSKGMEFEQVLIYANDFIDRDGNFTEDKLHYVAVTRAKSKLIINLDNTSYINYISSICNCKKIIKFI